MSEGTVIDGYVLTHPHDPYECAAEIHISLFESGDRPWMAQVFADGSLVDFHYFQTETDALRWAAREMTLIACVARTEEPA